MLASLAVVAAAAFVYRPALGAYFFDDDFQWLTGTWSFEPLRLLSFTDVSHFYRPVIGLYFGAATPLFGGSPALFHLANVVLHAANGLLLLALAYRLSYNSLFAFIAALLFVVQPADVDTIAWVSALAEALGTFFGCLALLSFLRFRRGGGSMAQLASVTAFALALLTHESSVVFFPLLVLIDGAADAQQPVGSGETWQSKAKAYGPFAAVLAAYLMVDLTVNSRNYLIVEGHYGLGSHAVANLFDYIVALYVGKGSIPSYVLIAALLTTVVLQGSRIAVFAVLWLVLTLLPFVFFRWENSARYVYLAAMGFSMLVAQGVVTIRRLLAPRLAPVPTMALVLIVAAAIAGRFAWFAVANVASFAARTEEYRQYVTLFKRIHGDLPSHSRVTPDARLSSHPQRFLNALIQWEYQDPTIQLLP